METLELSRAELWFCAPDTPAVGEARVFELRTVNEVRRVWTRLVPSKLPAISGGKPAYELFLQEETKRGLTAVLRYDSVLRWDDKEVADETVWRGDIRKMLSGRMSRVWLPSSSSRFCIALHSDGMGLIFGRNESFYEYSNTLFLSDESLNSQDFVWLPQIEFNSYVAQQFVDEISPLYLAYKWHGWSISERTAHALRCEFGTWEELHALAGLVLILTLKDGCEYDEDYMYWNPLFPDAFDPDYNVLSPWSEVIGRVFLPSCLREDAPLYEPSHIGEQWKLFPKRLPTQPSAHEKLEAHLRLRDWLRINAPEEEERLMGLFPPLSA